MSESSLHWLFLDLNAYFASVEQELRPELRERPIAIVPVDAKTTCCIAVSYEARRFGIRSGMSVATVRSLCPEVQLVVARPAIYAEMHHRIRAAIERCLPVHAALSCDEFCCALLGSEQTHPRAFAIAQQIKQELRQVGSTLRCSIGLGPNRLLAKIAAGLYKPNGLAAIEPQHLPQVLGGLQLSDIPGVGERMELRLRRAGIDSVRQLCALSRRRMAAVWGGVPGERLWLELRGEDLPEPSAAPQKTISRQHILPPPLRTGAGCRQIALKLLHDCVRRMRKQGLWAGGVGLAVYYVHHQNVFEAFHPIVPSQDAITLQEFFLPLVDGIPNQTPACVCVFLTELTSSPRPELFPPKTSSARAAAARAMDCIQQRFGNDAIYLASVHGARKEAPTRISFGPPPPLDEF